MLKLIKLEITKSHLWELHKAECWGLAKKADLGFEVESIEVAKICIEGENDILIAESEDEGAGYYFDRDVKVFPCVNH